MPSRKGSPNKLGVAVKANVVAVFDLIGGIKGMATWAKKNRTDFYKLYARLIPTEVVATISNRDASDYTDEELIAIASGAGAIGEASSEQRTGAVH